VLEEQALDTGRHDRAGFTCGVSALDEYLRRFAQQHKKKGVSAIYVLVESETPSMILGYYTLSAAQLDIADLSDPDRVKLPRFPVPCIRMARLACRAGRRGEGLGRHLIGCAVTRCLAASEQAGAFALVMDAKDADAKSFHRHYGFTPCTAAPMSLYLPLRR